jgi:PIN domain nuclease of toxin-antitoxin system
MQQQQQVLDASALLAYLHDEPGGDTVVLAGAIISSVNWSEVVQKAIAVGANTQGMRRDLESLGLIIVDFSAHEAELAAALWQATKALGLSLGDRACLALGMSKSLRVLTADQSWRRVSLPIAVKLIR